MSFSSHNRGSRQQIVTFVAEYLAEQNIECASQFGCGYYMIDLYLPEHKLAIEFDEFNHRDRNQVDEQKREEFIKRVLGCNFLRFNPDAADFKLTTCLGRIARHLR